MSQQIPAIETAHAEPAAQQTLAAVQKMLGGTPNLFRVAANAPAALESMVAQFGALARGKLPARDREAIALAVAQVNGCDYCLSAHSALGKGAGLSEAELRAARSGESPDAHRAALLSVARAITQRRGQLEPGALQAARRAGVTDAELVEVIAHVALNVFTNYVNIVAQTEIDFPVVRAGELG